MICCCDCTHRGALWQVDFSHVRIRFTIHIHGLTALQSPNQTPASFPKYVSILALLLPPHLFRHGFAAPTADLRADVESYRTLIASNCVPGHYSFSSAQHTPRQSEPL